MITSFFPLKKLRRNVKCLLFGVILLVGLVAVYQEMLAAKAWSNNIGQISEADRISWKRIIYEERIRRDHQPDTVGDPTAWASTYAPQPWKPEYMGQANLHVFEDWCGNSTADLRKNLHYPLYPHSRITVRKLAVSPQWTNYGLRIFGYLHPYANGDFVFAVSSDDNSEFWLSTDDSPLNLQLQAWVGMTGKEWSAPGEFEKYASQTSRPVRLSAQRKYFFEVIHKQNDRGTDHVEVAWLQLDRESPFTIIESKYISLYTDESALSMNDVAHIPQTAASHWHTPTKQRSAEADMLIEDRRDSFYKVHMLNSKFLRGVLPACSYKPSYTIKNFPLLRYQGLQFVHLSYIYPNDYTRLTHMETHTSCFYSESSYYLKMFGFRRYMKLDSPAMEERENLRNFNFQRWKRIQDKADSDTEIHKKKKEVQLDDMNNGLLRDYGDDYDDYVQNRRRKLFSLVVPKTNNTVDNSSYARLHRDTLEKRESEGNSSVLKQGLAHNLQQNQAELQNEGPVQKAKQQRFVTRDREFVQPNNKRFTPGKRDFRRPLVRSNQRDSNVRNSLRDKEIKLNMPLQQDLENSMPRAKKIAKGKVDKKWLDKKEERGQGREEDEVYNRSERRRNYTEDERDYLWGRRGEFNGADDEDLTPAPVFDIHVNWNQTFQASHLDLQAQRSDWINLQCNISGNLLLRPSDALAIVKRFMDELNAKHHGQFKLVSIVNVVKRVDGFQGSRYLLELELQDVNGQLLRLSHYIYALVRHGKLRSREFIFQQSQPDMLLCNPVGFHWNPVATVHFIVPVKNQARWVQQLITDMEELFRKTRDVNFNLIITDYNSTDMDVRKALQKSSLPRYQYVKLGGNFERSAGLQAGIDLITDDHSIVFLCDLHIGFPLSIIDTIRKHCVEGYMAFAPIVLRLDCGATPLEARGYWEVNGFGLLGIYKSDLDKVGGMNTKEFTDRWGGEDWELLDRILQAGLEVERIYLRNFFHHYHSKRGMWNRRMSRSPR